MVNTVADLREVKQRGLGKIFGSGHWEVIWIQCCLMVDRVLETDCLKGTLGLHENTMCPH